MLSNVSCLPFKKTLVGFPALASAVKRFEKVVSSQIVVMLTANDLPLHHRFALRLKRQVVAFGPSPLHRSPRSASHLDPHRDCRGQRNPTA